jgi:hypothetical protein
MRCEDVLLQSQTKLRPFASRPARLLDLSLSRSSDISWLESQPRIRSLTSRIQFLRLDAIQAARFDLVRRVFEDAILQKPAKLR